MSTTVSETALKNLNGFSHVTMGFRNYLEWHNKYCQRKNKYHEQYFRKYNGSNNCSYQAAWVRQQWVTPWQSHPCHQCQRNEEERGAWGQGIQWRSYHQQGPLGILGMTWFFHHSAWETRHFSTNQDGCCRLSCSTQKRCTGSLRRLKKNNHQL